MKFQISDQVFADRVHAPGGPYQKGIVYDTAALKLAPKTVKQLMALRMGAKGPHFFEEVTDHG